MSKTTYHYPLDFTFRISTFSNDFIAKDAAGKTIFYVREKMFKLKDHIKIYNDETKSQEIYDIVSNKIIDFQQTFTITDTQNQTIGKVRKKTLKSFIKAHYQIQDANGNEVFTVSERSFTTRMMDDVLGEIPVVGMLSGYVFNPKYVVKDSTGKELMELKKEPSFFGRRFKVEKLSNDDFNEEQILLSLVLMILQQRNRG